MDVNETAFLKELVNGECEPAPHTKNATKKIRARTQMRDLAEKLRRVTLFLERIGIIGGSNDVDLVRDEFPLLSFTLGSDQRPTHANGSARRQPLHIRVIWQRVRGDNLQIAQRRSIVQLDERKILRIAPGPHPPLHLNGIDWRGALQCIFDGYWRTLRHVNDKRFLQTFA